jgi:glucose-6-phosphate isomerase
MNLQTETLSAELRKEIKETLDDWQVNDKMRKLWAGDTTLWTSDDEDEWVGWLDITGAQLADVERLQAVAEDVKSAGFSSALLMGMGGSSLCPEVLRLTFGKIPGFPELQVLDSTDPAQVKTRERQIDLADTLFIVSSKSGRTLEPNIFKQYFFELVKQKLGASEAGQRFIAITDPESDLVDSATKDQFRHTFLGLPTIGGRYSALSDFGMVPAAIMGIDVKKFLQQTQEMVAACGPSTPIAENPGAFLGAILGTAQMKFQRNKITIIASPAIRDLGAWLEQLLAESTGKNKTGLIPVDLERPAAPETYGKDRLFAYLRLETDPDAAQDAAVAALERADQPVLRIAIEDIYNLGQEFFRWEMATAVASSIMGVNPFNQPDVEASKIATRELTNEYDQTGKLPSENPFFKEDGITLLDEEAGSVLELGAGESPSLSAYLKAHLSRIAPGKYFALLAYIEMNEEHTAALQELRHAVRDHYRVATCLGFGPRFLHSTGQAYKGGPKTGVFLQVTCDDAADLAVPDEKYSFGVVKSAQARGDFRVLLERGQSVLRAHLGPDVKAGLQRLSEAINEALN